MTCDMEGALPQGQILRVCQRGLVGRKRQYWRDELTDVLIVSVNAGS